MECLKVFNYEENDVRTLIIDGEPWWVLADVCAVLDLSEPHRVAARLDEDEKGRTSITTLGGAQNMNIVNESGLYSVILRSDKPEAKTFKRWITHEVLPALRKTGSYSLERPAPSAETGLQRAGLIIRAAEHKAVPQSEQLRLLDMAVRDLTGTGLNLTPVTDTREVSLMDLPEAIGVLKKGTRKKFSGTFGGHMTVQFYTLTEIADMAGVAPAAFNCFADEHNLKKSPNGEWVRVSTSTGEAREFLYLQDVIREYFAKEEE